MCVMTTIRFAFKPKFVKECFPFCSEYSDVRETCRMFEVVQDGEILDYIWSEHWF